MTKKVEQPARPIRQFIAGTPAESADVQEATFAGAKVLHVTLNREAFGYPKEFDLTVASAKELITRLTEAIEK